MASTGAVVYDGRSVLAAAQAWWRATPAAMALASDGKLWFKSAPEHVALPYATFFLVSDVTEFQTTAYFWNRSSLQFNFHAATATQAESMANAFAALVDRAPLSVGGEPVAHVLPDDFRLEIGEGLGPGGRDCWIGIQTVDIPYT